MTDYPDFSALVAAATADVDHPEGHTPYRYQCLIADGGFPDVLSVPTGSGKTMAAVLPYLWRRIYHPDAAVRAATPRRLILALPTRALIDQTGRLVEAWLARLGLTSEVGVHVLMGGRNDHQTQNAWRINLHRPTIVICTLDMLVSRALLRGYGSYRGSYPLDFALVCNGAHIVVDETQLVPQATATLRQIAAFQRSYGTAEPSGLTIMSATVDDRVLSTYDNPFDPATAHIVGLPPEDAAGGLATRLRATRTIRRLDDTSTPKALADQILSLHVPQTLTLAVFNTVEAARDTYRALLRAKPDAETLLIHSRFRGVERQAQLDRLDRISAHGGIVIATQAIEAGVDIDARTLITETAPWPSIVQRAGRCNRAGRFPDGEATLWWCLPAKSAPYAEEQVSAAAEALTSAEGEALTSLQLQDLGRDLPQQDLALRILRRRDFDQLFDTTPDLGGADIDISVYIRPDQDLDVHLAWVPDGAMPNPNVIVPPEKLRCPVSLVSAAKFLKKENVKAWVFRPQQDRWVPARQAQLRPQDIVLVEASSGGYDAELGFDPSSRSIVDPRLTQSEVTAVAAPESPAASQDPGAAGVGWLTLDQHLEDARAQAESLVTALSPADVAESALHAAVVAALLHDVGKAHPDWNQALREANLDQPPPDPEALYAKSPGRSPLQVMRSFAWGTPRGDSSLASAIPSGAMSPMASTGRRSGFRHELVSVFMLSSAAADELLATLGVAPEQRPLVRYLVGAHHGHLRISARDPRYDGRDGRTLLGCDDGEPTPGVVLPCGEIPASTVDLGIFRPGRPDSWTAAALALRDAFGPFRLAYLETLVRMADWRASANLPLAGES